MVKSLVDAGVGVLSFVPERMNLEALFLSVTGRSDAAQGGDA
jgi:hypothetical protein